MKVLHVIPTFYPAVYWGGPMYSVYGLCNSTATIPGVTLRVLTTNSAGPSLSDSVEVTGYPMRYSAGYDVFFCERRWGGSISPTMLLRLWPMIRWADVVHLTAVYSPPIIPTLVICRLLDKPVVWSPRGALQRWEGSTKPLLKRAWEWVCNAVIKQGRCVLHVTSPQEASDSIARIPKATVAIVPNGVDIPAAAPARNWLPNGPLRLLYIGRLHPKKGIENILHALKIAGNETVSLAICGVGDEVYSRSLRDLAQRLGLGEHRVNFQGHVEGEEKMKAFMQADVCVVPSYTENFGMVVAEALAHGVPVIASKGTPWAEVETRDCGLWVENAPANLADAIARIRTRTLSEMGARGRDWMKESNGWDAIAARLFSSYEKLTKDHGPIRSYKDEITK